jgi:cold shock CspA family protein
VLTFDDRVFDVARMGVLIRGKVLRFDEIRGYGFIAPEDGGDDVFMHANDFRDDETLFRPGAVVEFELEDGDRGPKASNIRVVERNAGAPAGGGANADAGRRTQVVGDSDDGLCDVLTTREFRHEVTDVLIESAPTLTAAQIGAVRERLANFAKSHGWIES